MESIGSHVTGDSLDSPWRGCDQYDYTDGFLVDDRTPASAAGRCHRRRRLLTDASDSSIPSPTRASSTPPSSLAAECSLQRPSPPLTPRSPVLPPRRRWVLTVHCSVCTSTYARVALWVLVECVGARIRFRFGLYSGRRCLTSCHPPATCTRTHMTTPPHAGRRVFRRPRPSDSSGEEGENAFASTSSQPTQSTQPLSSTAGFSSVISTGGQIEDYSARRGGHCRSPTPCARVPGRQAVFVSPSPLKISPFFCGGGSRIASPERQQHPSRLERRRTCQWTSPMGGGRCYHAAFIGPSTISHTIALTRRGR